MVTGHSFIQSFSISKALIYGAYTACSRIGSAKVGLGTLCKTPVQVCLPRRDEEATIRPMKQADLGLNLTTKRTRKREFLAQMERMVPWVALVELVAPYGPQGHKGHKGHKGRPPFAVETMLRIHCMQQWFTLSDPTMEASLYDIALFREFAGLGWDGRLPDESTILRFRHLLEKNRLAEQILGLVNELLRSKGLMLKAGTVVDATLIAAPSSTKNQSGERDPEMHQSKKGNLWFFGMKAHISVDAHSGLVHTVKGKAGNVNDVVEANSLLHGGETDVFADAGYQSAGKRPDAKKGVAWHIAMRPGKRRALDKDHLVDRLGRRDRAPEGQRTCQGQAPVPGGQAAVRACQGALPRAEEEHGAVDDAVRDVQPVDGARKVDSTGWTSPSESCVCGLKNAENQPARRAIRAPGGFSCTNSTGSTGSRRRSCWM